MSVFCTIVLAFYGKINVLELLKWCRCVLKMEQGQPEMSLILSSWGIEVDSLIWFRQMFTRTELVTVRWGTCFGLTPLRIIIPIQFFGTIIRLCESLLALTSFSFIAMIHLFHHPAHIYLSFYICWHCNIVTCCNSQRDVMCLSQSHMHAPGSTTSTMY